MRVFLDEIVGQMKQEKTWEKVWVELFSKKYEVKIETHIAIHPFILEISLKGAIIYEGFLYGLPEIKLSFSYKSIDFPHHWYRLVEEIYKTYGEILKRIGLPSEHEKKVINYLFEFLFKEIKKGLK